MLEMGGGGRKKEKKTDMFANANSIYVKIHFHDLTNVILMHTENLYFDRKFLENFLTKKIV